MNDPNATTDPISRSIAYLNSEEAARSVAEDPYWPKWDSPWWHMTLLWEMGLAEKIPAAATRRMTQAIRNHYLPFFPLEAESLPPGCDAYRHVACHCGLGTMVQVLGACGVNVDREIPWIRPWFLKYQLRDGGLNCHEAAYSKTVPKSSIVSTLPVLEAVLLRAHRPHTEAELAFLDRGAQYLIAHKLFRSAGAGKIINEEWTRVCFPRFYEYDILRGLLFLARWSRIRKKPFPMEAAAETIDIIRKNFPDDRIAPQRLCYADAQTRAKGADGRWDQWHPASTFELLDNASRIGIVSEKLTDQWNEVLKTIPKAQRTNAG